MDMNNEVTTEEMSEINALLRLIDDPDEDIYEAVQSKLMSFGHKILDIVYDYRDHALDDIVIIRTSQLIQSLRLDHNFRQWVDWKKNTGSALEAMHLIGNLLDNEYNALEFKRNYNKIKQSLWLDINLYMSPLEVFHTVTSVVYSQYNFKIVDSQNLIDKKAFHPNKIFDKKNINQYFFALMMTTILDEIDVNIKAIKLPYQLLLVYFEIKNPFKHSAQKETIFKLSAYLDPKTAETFSENDIEMFFKKIDLEIKKDYFLPLSYYQLTFLTIYDLFKMVGNSSDDVLYNHLHRIIVHVFDAHIEK